MPGDVTLKLSFYVKSYHTLVRFTCKIMLNDYFIGFMKSESKVELILLANYKLYIINIETQEYLIRIVNGGSIAVKKH